MRIVRGSPDPEFIQDLECAGIDYELGGPMSFEESSEWGGVAIVGRMA
jgi:hypothetical protein